jgi:hypothetical protein
MEWDFEGWAVERFAITGPGFSELQRTLVSFKVFLRITNGAVNYTPAT